MFILIGAGKTPFFGAFTMAKTSAYFFFHKIDRCHYFPILSCLQCLTRDDSRWKLDFMANFMIDFTPKRVDPRK